MQIAFLATLSLTRLEWEDDGSMMRTAASLQRMDTCAQTRCVALLEVILLRVAEIFQIRKMPEGACMYVDCLRCLAAFCMGIRNSGIPSILTMQHTVHIYKIQLALLRYVRPSYSGLPTTESTSKPLSRLCCQCFAS